MKIVIVGGVAGGAGTAARLRRNDENAEILILEKSGFISYANCGMPYYIGGVIPQEEDLLIQTPESFFRRFYVNVRVKNEVISVDCSTKSLRVKDLNTGEIYVETYDILVLSPGVRPNKPVIETEEGANLLTLRSMEDTRRIKEFIDRVKPKTAVIIGGGFIGLEMAENLSRRGVQTVILEAAGHVISGLDPDMAHELHNHLRSNGVAVFTGVKADFIGKNTVRLENGRYLPASVVLLCTGVSPDTAFLSGSGIRLGEKGEILVNKELETNIRGVYALGDAIAVKHICSGKDKVIPLAGPANKQARIVADVICNKPASYRGTQGTAIARVFDRTVALTGLCEEELILEKTAYAKTVTFSYSNATYYPGYGFMTIKLLFSKQDGQLYGAQIIGTKGVDKHIDLISAAVRGGWSIYDLQELECAYAPPYSSAKNPVNMAGFVAENILNGHSDPAYAQEVQGLPKTTGLLDVRTPYEYARGCIEGAVNIPLDELREKLHLLDKNREWVVNCQTGLRSYIAERILKQNGFKVRNLMGGFRHYAQMQSDKNTVDK